MKIVHKTLGVDVEMPEILQGQLEEFEAIIQPHVALVNEGNAQLAKFNGAVVRAAVQVGWLPGLSEDDIAKMKPAKVSFLANEVSAALIQAREVPPQ